MDITIAKKNKYAVGVLLKHHGVDSTPYLIDKK